MIFCFNCGTKIFVNETYWEDPIHYEENEVKIIEKYLDDVKDLPNLLTIPQKWIVIDAPTGAGKTTKIEKLLAADTDSKVLVIAKFTTLVRNLAEKFQLTFYKEGANKYHPPTDRYACTLDHVCTLINSSYLLREWDIIVLDEASMTRNHTTSSTIREK